MKVVFQPDRRAGARSPLRSRVILLLAGMGLVAAACGDGGSNEATSALVEPTSTVVATAAPVAATTPAPAISEVTVDEDLVYLATEPVPWKLDVFSSPASEGGPVVVFFHGGSASRKYATYTTIAEAIAAEGGVVFMPDWDDSMPSPALPAIVDAFAPSFDAAGCAVSYALAHASDYGADPEWLVLAGHSAGASVPPAAGGLREVAPVADCAVEMDATDIDGMVLWDGDWLMGGPLWDRYGTDLPEIMDAFFPWAWLEDARKVPVVLATSSRSPDELHRCDVDDPDSSYWVRDPDGWFHDQLVQFGMLDDGCIDNGEGEELLANTMRTHRFDATHLILEDSGHVSLSDQGRAQLVEAILTISDR